MALVVVPGSSYEMETATAYCWPLGDYVPGQEGVTLEQLKALCCKAHSYDEAKFDAMTPKERFRFLVEDVGYYTFDQLVAIDTSRLDELEQLSDEALDHGSDSAWYEACQWYHVAMREMGEKTMSFYSDGVIEEDPDY